MMPHLKDPRPLLWGAAILAALFAWLYAFNTAGAFEPWNIHNWPGTTQDSSPINGQVARTGEMTWQAVDQYGWAGWHDIVAKSLNSGSVDPLSEGNALNDFLRNDHRGQVNIREIRSGEQPDIQHFAVTAAFQAAKCNGEWSTACVFLLNARPVPAYYKASLMILWGYESQAPVVRHETWHALARACDEYRGGCPRASDGVWEANVVCTGNPDTLMDCGGAARTITWFDYQTFLMAYKPETFFLRIVPDAPPEWGPCEHNDKGQVWCFNTIEGNWHWTIWVETPDGSTYGQEWRSKDSSPWYCVDRCP